jgi:hypothetical protein
MPADGEFSAGAAVEMRSQGMGVSGRNIPRNGFGLVDLEDFAPPICFALGCRI